MLPGQANTKHSSLLTGPSLTATGMEKSVRSWKASPSHSTSPLTSSGGQKNPQQAIKNYGTSYTSTYLRSKGNVLEKSL